MKYVKVIEVWMNWKTSWLYCIILHFKFKSKSLLFTQWRLLQPQLDAHWAVTGMSALPLHESRTWVLDLVWAAPCPHFSETCSPLRESLYFSVTVISPPIWNFFWDILQVCSLFPPLETDSLTLAWSVTMFLSGMVYWEAPISVLDPADWLQSLAYPSHPAWEPASLEEASRDPLRVLAWREAPPEHPQKGSGSAQPQAGSGAGQPQVL